MSTTPGTPASCKHGRDRAKRKATVGFWKLVALGEPFRLLFPVGIVMGCFGVLLWPLYIWNFTSVYPNISHPRVMLEGFMTSFVIGFLGTALPRLLDVAKFGRFESIAYAGGVSLCTWFHATGNTVPGDHMFLFILAAFVCDLLLRAGARKDIPPPAFVLVGLGMLCALTGVIGQIAVASAPELLPDWLHPLSKVLLYQGFLLLPVMGVGAFLLPRFFGLPNRQNFPESMTPPPGWWFEALFALACGVAVLGSFVLQVAGHVQAAYALRAVGFLVYLARELPVHRAGIGGGSLALGLRVALLSLPLGFLMIAIWPAYALSFLHIVYISGISLLTLIVASRVVLGHSGQAKLFQAPLRSVLFMTALITLAMLTRVTADWLPAIRMSHYAYASITWVLGATIWGVAILPSVCRADED